MLDDSCNVWLPVRLARLSNYGLYGWRWGGFDKYVILQLWLLGFAKLWGDDWSLGQLCPV